MKKVLIITYYWPPAGGPGVQRVLKFAKYLPDFSWQPIILTVENGEYPAIDESLLDDIPPGIKVYKTKSFEPFNLYKGITGQKGNIPTHVLNKSENESALQKLSKWIRANVFIPDARVGWIPSIIKEGMKIIEKEKPDLIFSSSPPHSLQIGAMKLAKKSGLKWVADFRDPWTDGFWQKDLPRTRIASMHDLRLEKKVLNKADCVTTVSEGFKDLFRKKCDNNFTIITNGYEKNDFVNLVPQKNDIIFRITYSGSIRRSQFPFKFFEALRILKKENKIDKLRIVFVGTQHPDLNRILTKYELKDIIIMQDYVKHDLLIQNIIDSDVLLVLIPNTDKNQGIIPAKLFEYIGSGNFILGIGPPHGDAGKILQELNCGVMFDFADDLKDFILYKYTEWRQRKLQPRMYSSEKYQRNILTKTLVKTFDSLI